MRRWTSLSLSIAGAATACADGLLAEHWDVLQDEATEAESQAKLTRAKRCSPIKALQQIASAPLGTGRVHRYLATAAMAGEFRGVRMNFANSILYTPSSHSIDVAARRSPDWDGARCTRSPDRSPARRTLDFAA